MKDQPEIIFKDLERRSLSVNHQSNYGTMVGVEEPNAAWKEVDYDC